MKNDLASEARRGPKRVCSGCASTSVQAGVSTRACVCANLYGWRKEAFLFVSCSNTIGMKELVSWERFLTIVQGSQQRNVLND